MPCAAWQGEQSKFLAKNYACITKRSTERTLLLRRSLALLETLYTSCGVDSLFLSGKEWVARATDLNIDLWHRRTNGELLAA
jgi:hypothetical protein